MGRLGAVSLIPTRLGLRLLSTRLLTQRPTSHERIKYTVVEWLRTAQIVGEIALAGAIGGARFWAITAAGSGAGKVR